MSADLHYKLISTEAELDALCDELKDAKIIAVDTETEGIGFTDIIVGIALSHKPDHGYYIPIRHEAVDGIRYTDQLEPRLVFDKLKPILETVPCTGHNSKFDLKMFWKDGININYKHDTLLLAHVLGVDANGSRGLKQLVSKIFGHQMNDLDSLFPRVGNRRPDIRPKILAPKDIEFYGCEDGNWSLKLFLYLNKLLADNPSQRQVYAIEMALLPVVAEMEAFGVPVSREFLETGSAKAEEYLVQLKESIMNDIRTELKDPEYEINLKSTQQLGKLLFDRLGLPIIKTSPKTGKPSTDSSVLQELAKMSPIVQNIMTFRDLEKLNNTYLSGLQDRVEFDGRIHGSFNQAGTASGRFSSSEPNLQNLPKDQTFTFWPVTHPQEELDVFEHFNNLEVPLMRKMGDKYEAYIEEVDIWKDTGYVGPYNGREYGVSDGEIYEMWKCKTRKFIEAPEDHYLIEADYSQVELRIMAGESQEPTLLNAYNTGDDVHRSTAGVIFDTPFEEVTSEQRHIGKTVNFSLLYGAGPYNISQQLNISVEEAEDIVNRYFQNLSAVQSWINRMKKDTKMDMYADTVFGRRRRFPNVKGSDRKLAEKELRESVNHHIQGAAADIMKTALVRASRQLRQHFGDRVKIISTVHDSVLVECHNSCPKEEVIFVLKRAMENFTTDLAQRKALADGTITENELTIVAGWPRLEIDSKVGKSWGEAKDFKGAPVEPSEEVDVATLDPIRVRQIAVELEEPSTDEIKWVLEIERPIGVEELGWLKSFLTERKDDSTNQHVTLTYVDQDGTIQEMALSGTYKLSFEDDSELRIKFGSCNLRQDLDGLDYGEVLKGVDFGL